jgi:hypothetical protein
VSDDPLKLLCVRAAIRGPAERPGERWSQAVVGWLPEVGQLWCDQHPNARDCAHIRLVRETLSDRTNP